MKSSIFGTLIVGMALLMVGCANSWPDFAEFGTQEYDDAWSKLAGNTVSDEFTHPIDIYIQGWDVPYGYWKLLEPTESRGAKVEWFGAWSVDLVGSAGSFHWMDQLDGQQVYPIGRLKLSEVDGFFAVAEEESVTIMLFASNALGGLFERTTVISLEAYSDRFLPYVKQHSDLVLLDPANGRERFESELIPRLIRPEIFTSPQAGGMLDPDFPRLDGTSGEVERSIDYYALPVSETPNETVPTLDA